MVDTAPRSRADSLQVVSFLGMSAIVILFCVLRDAPIPFAAGMALAAVSVALLGIPHGALDLMHLKTLAWRLQRASVLWVGLAVYVLLALAVIAAWVAFPATMLTVFLIATVLHWGSEDARVPQAWGLGYVCEVLLRGTMPILLPSLFHTAETTWLFSQLIPSDAASLLTQLIASAWPLLIALAILLLGSLAAHGASAVREHFSTLLELATVAALFALTPPLIAFAVYFGFLHSARFLARYARDGHSGQRRATSRMEVKDALPMTLLTWVLAIGAVMLLWPERTSAQLSLQVVFIGLAALTFPHALLMMSLRFIKPREPGDVS